MMTNKLIRKREKIRAQMKSRFYYWFWGATAVAVVGGQIYVGSGYRQMAKAFNRIIDTTMKIVKPKPRGYYAPIVPPPPDNYMYRGTEDKIHYLENE
tara:strand:- start:286 stop:576 length:291 start_codon:yes stop_codon:yes gene_type:complete